MPNWCYNRITVYGSEESEAKLKEIEEIFEKENPFNEIYPIPDFKNIPNEKGELPKLEQHKNDKGDVVWETFNFPDGTNDDRWYIGALKTGEQSGMLATNPLIMRMMRFSHLHSILRGVHPKVLLKDCVRSIQNLHSNVSMMSQEWNQQGITRTVCKVSTWGCMRDPIPL